MLLSHAVLCRKRSPKRQVPHTALTSARPRLRAVAETIECYSKETGLAGIEPGIAAVKNEFVATDAAFRKYLGA